MKTLILGSGIALLCLTAPATAETIQDTDIAACFSIQDSSTRLECYDNLAKRSMRSAEEIAVEKKEKEKKRFGLWAREKPKTVKDFGKPEPLEITSISSSIEEISFTKQIAKRIVLSNGQVWSQLNSDTRFLKPFRVERYKNETITVKKAALGSFRMRIGEDGPIIRVRRIK